MSPRRFKPAETPGPNFNRGWRLGVAVGAALVLLAAFGFLGGFAAGVIGVWVE